MSALRHRQSIGRRSKTSAQVKGFRRRPIAGTEVRVGGRRQDALLAARHQRRRSMAENSAIDWTGYDMEPGEVASRPVVKGKACAGVEGVCGPSLAERTGPTPVTTAALSAVPQTCLTNMMLPPSSSHPRCVPDAETRHPSAMWWKRNGQSLDKHDLLQAACPKWARQRPWLAKKPPAGRYGR